MPVRALSLSGCTGSRPWKAGCSRVASAGKKAGKTALAQRQSTGTERNEAVSSSPMPPVACMRSLTRV